MIASILCIARELWAEGEIAGLLPSRIGRVLVADYLLVLEDRWRS
jgi:hypothetical protein